MKTLDEAYQVIATTKPSLSEKKRIEDEVDRFKEFGDEIMSHDASISMVRFQLDQIIESSDINLTQAVQEAIAAALLCMLVTGVKVGIELERP